MGLRCVPTSGPAHNRRGRLRSPGEQPVRYRSLHRAARSHTHRLFAESLQRPRFCASLARTGLPRPGGSLRLFARGRWQGTCAHPLRFLPPPHAVRTRQPYRAVEIAKMLRAVRVLRAGKTGLNCAGSSLAWVTLQRPPPDTSTLDRNVFPFSSNETLSPGSACKHASAPKKPAAPPPITTKSTSTQEIIILVCCAHGIAVSSCFLAAPSLASSGGTSSSLKSACAS